MNVATILKQKGRSVATVAPTATLQEVAKRLAQRRIGALVVVGSRGQIEGIVSERDIIRALSETGAGCLGRPVADTMTRQVATCQETDTLDEMMAMMTQGRFRHVPVVTDGDLVGIISIGDVVKRRIEDVEREAAQIREYIATA